MKKHDTSRRQFLRKGGFGLALAVPIAMIFNRVLMGGSAHAADKPADKKAPPAKAGGKQTPPPGLTMANPNDPMAKTLGYHEDAAKVDVKKWPKRAGAEGAKQFCNNCALYQSKTKDDVAAPCMVLQNKGVWGKGWCNSWALKS